MGKQEQQNTEKKKNQNGVLITLDPDFPDMWYRRKLTEGLRLPEFLSEQLEEYEKKLKDIQMGNRAVTPRKAICDICMNGISYRIYDVFLDHGQIYAYGMELNIPYDQKQKAEFFRITHNNEFHTISEQQQQQMCQVYSWEYRLLDVVPKCVRHLLWDHIDKIQLNSFLAERNHSYTVPEVTGWIPRPFPHGKAHVVIRNTIDPVSVTNGITVGSDRGIRTPLDGYMIADIVGLPEIRDTFVALAYQKQEEKAVPICEKPVYFLFKRDKKKKLDISRIPDCDLEFYLEKCGLLERFTLIMAQLKDLQFLYV